MCGIIYIRDFNGLPVSDLVEKAYHLQSHRGRSGYGFIELNKDKLMLKRFVHEEKAISMLKESKSSEILFHHRIPTSTINSSVSNHPLFNIDNYKSNYYMVHNGGIHNKYLMKAEHEKMGIKYNSYVDGDFNDSEALLNELALIVDGKKDIKDFGIKGSMAFILLETDKLNRAKALYYGRNTNPLIMTTTKDKIFSLRSEGNGKLIESNILYRFDYVTRETTKKQILLPGIRYTQSHDFIKHIQTIKKEPVKKVETVEPKGDLSIVTRTMIRNGRVSNDTICTFSKDDIKGLLILSRLLLSNLQIEYEKSIIVKNLLDRAKYNYHIDTQIHNEEALSYQHNIL